MKHTTDEEKAIVRKGWRDGLTLRQIGDKIGASKGRVSGIRTRLHLAERPHPAKWTDADVDKLEAALAEGWGWRAVAVVLKRTVESCKQKAAFFGFKGPRARQTEIGQGVAAKAARKLHEIEIACAKAERDTAPLFKVGPL